MTAASRYCTRWPRPNATLNTTSRTAEVSFEPMQDEGALHLFPQAPRHHGDRGESPRIAIRQVVDRQAATDQPYNQAATDDPLPDLGLWHHTQGPSA